MPVCDPYSGGITALAGSYRGGYSENELSAMTKAQIAELAVELGYEGITTSMTKAEMIAAFLEAQED